MKTTFVNGTIVLALATLIQACALTPQNLHLNPVIDFSGAPVTSDTLIGLSVVDTRPSKKLGEVGDPIKEMVPVTLDEDFTALLYQRLSEALAKRGFSVVPESNAMTRGIGVRVSSLTLNSVKTPVKFETELKAEVAATAHNASESYDRLYYVRSYKETAGPPYEKHSNQLVNEAVNQALADLMNDDKLFEMLAR